MCIREGIHRGPLYSGPIVYKTYEAGYFALAAEVNILSAIPPTYGSRTVALGDGSQVVVAVDSTSKVAMLGFSASDTTLQQVPSWAFICHSAASPMVPMHCSMPIAHWSIPTGWIPHVHWSIPPVHRSTLVGWLSKQQSLYADISGLCASHHGSPAALTSTATSAGLVLMIVHISW